MITTDRDLRKMRKRITWTSFHLPSTQPWPTWAGPAIAGGNETTDPYRGVLHKVPGLENVRLARRAEDVEQAAYILLWSSADAFASFQSSSRYTLFMDSLEPFKAVFSETIDKSPARTVSLQWDHGFDIDTELHGRVTLNKFTGLGTWNSWHEARRDAFVGFAPLGCKDVVQKRPPMRNWCIAWVDRQGGEQQGMWTSVDSNASRKEPVGKVGDPSEGEKVIQRGDEHVRERWEFLRWNEPSYGATRGREEDSTKQPAATQHWKEAVRRYMPPVQTWSYERWDIEQPPQPPVASDEDDVETDEEELDFEIEEDDSLPVGIR